MKKLLDWSDYHDQGMGDAYADIPKHGEDFAKAVSVCIRSGVCQETDNRGVMCPSFKIHQDPSLSPGGRVHLLKNLLNRDDQSFLTDPELAASLDNCVSCKGCKRECENNLDMAAIKAEYMGQRVAAGYRSLRSFIFAEMPFLLYKYPWIGRLIRIRNRSSILTKIGQWILRINGSIPLPEPAEKPFSSSKTIDSKLLEQADSEQKSVVLLVDSFTALFNPESAEDAEKLLNAAGYQVIVLHPQSESRTQVLDSGRSLFSQGYIERTQIQAEYLVEILAPHLKTGRRIIGLEPSALLMLRDEYQKLDLGEFSTSLINQAFLLEEFISRETVAGRFNVEFVSSEESNKVLVHGHCHQKAVGAMKSMRKVLKLIPKLNFHFIEASCCGMAGSYGMEQEHAKESLEMAGLGLLPELDQDPDAMVVCNGFSCSHQILALRNRKPIHLATILTRHLKISD
jgi:glycerol-3-phosphate dehydrogenase subunit C